MGINIGALISPLVCGYLGENINWHYGFGAAGGGTDHRTSIQYVLGSKYLGEGGLTASRTAGDFRLLRRVLAGSLIVIVVGTAAALSGLLPFTAEGLSDVFGVLLTGIVVVFFIWLLSAKGYSPVERSHACRAISPCCSSHRPAPPVHAFERAGSTLNLFAERNTNMHHWDFSLWGLFRASYFQSFNSIFLVALAPVLAGLWVRLGRSEPTSTAKFSWNLSPRWLRFRDPDSCCRTIFQREPWWLTLTYLLHTIGELCLSPADMSAMTKPRARPHCRADDGNLVPLDFSGRFHRWTSRFGL